MGHFTFRPCLSVPHKYRRLSAQDIESLVPPSKRSQHDASLPRPRSQGPARNSRGSVFLNISNHQCEPRVSTSFKARQAQEPWDSLSRRKVASCQEDPCPRWPGLLHAERPTPSACGVQLSRAKKARTVPNKLPRVVDIGLGDRPELRCTYPSSRREFRCLLGADVQ